MTTLTRQLSLTDAVFVGLAAMLGAGVFAALSPALQAAGSWVWLSLLIAALIAYCNAVSSAQLAARHPQAGGTYLYARERLHPAAGYVAGACFLVGKTGSGAAMALTFAHYAAPGLEKPAALLALAVLTGVNLLGLQKTARVSRWIVVVVIATLLSLSALLLSADTVSMQYLAFSDAPDGHGILQGAAIWFFAFAGYARLATLAEEVKSPERVLTRAIPIALFIVLGLYILISLCALLAVGPDALRDSAAPLAAAVTAAGYAPLTPALRAVAALACLGVLVALIAGISRTLFAMSRNGDMPRGFIHLSAAGVPWRAELLVAAAMALAIVLFDLTAAIGFSAFSVLLYYALANASALKLQASERRWSRLWSVLGVFGCVLLAFNLPFVALVSGSITVALLFLLYWVKKGRHQ